MNRRIPKMKEPVLKSLATYKDTTLVVKHLTTTSYHFDCPEFVLVLGFVLKLNHRNSPLLVIKCWFINC